MGSGAQKRTLMAAWIASCGVIALHQACAEPPRQKVTIALSRDSKSSQSVALPIAGRLDLRPVEVRMSNEGAAAIPLNAGFSTGNHRFSANQSASQYDSHAARSAASTHIMSPLQNLAHNFRQEGLPVVKLLQSDQSLLHLGLNPKGKPGLWFVHKLD
jgi:hypothetical protein